MDSFITLMKDNPQVAGALTLVLGGVISYLARSVPQIIWDFIMSQTTSRIDVDNSDWWEGAHNYTAIRKWYVEHGLVWIARKFRMEVDRTITAGGGRHYFFYRRRLFWFKTIELQSSGVTYNKYEMEITCLSRDPKRLLEFVREVTSPESGPKTSINVYEPDQVGENVHWAALGTLPLRQLFAPLANSATVDKILADLDRFTLKKDWFAKQNVAYKRAYLFYGPPGTGKTTLAVEIASLTKRDVYRLNFDCIQHNKFNRVIGQIPSGSVILVEDIHSSASVLKEEFRPKTNMFTPINTLTAILNLLDGAVPLNDMLVIITTNYLERIEPAIYRPGRVNLLEEISYLESVTVSDWLIDRYGDELQYTKSLTFPVNLVAAEVYRLFELHRDDHHAVVRELLDYTSAPTDPVIHAIA